MLSLLKPFALVMVLVLSACSLNKSSESFCSEKQTACPAGTVCDGKKCVVGQVPDATPDAPLDGGAKDTASVDSTSSDSAAEETPVPDVFVNPCDGVDDGTACGEEQNMICLDGVCVVPYCGDGYRSDDEECDDGNDIAEDGCTACEYDCQAHSDCNDTMICNGAESCDTTSHTCSKGEDAEDGTSCSPPDGGICKAGGCVDPSCGDGTQTGDEECDDGNKVPGDGCENDCTYSCETAAECIDNDLCNGTESCDTTTHTCTEGEKVACTIPSGADPNCTVTCEPSSGLCVYADLDGDLTTCDTDCVDTNPVIYPGATECADAFDNDCDPSTPDGSGGDCLCWEDPDGDGYATTSAATKTASPCPSGFTDLDPAVADDCKEGNASVHPAQDGWFTEPYCQIKISANQCLYSFDYDCSDNEEQQYPSVRACKKTIYQTCVGAGWLGSTVPDCGDKEFYGGCTLNGGVCEPQSLVGQRTQSCH